MPDQILKPGKTFFFLGGATLGPKLSPGKIYIKARPNQWGQARFYSLPRKLTIHYLYLHFKTPPAIISNYFFLIVGVCNNQWNSLLNSFFNMRSGSVEGKKEHAV